MVTILEREIMNWTIILKNDPFEGFPGKSKSPAWLKLLGKDFAELGQWIQFANQKLEEDSSPPNFATFIRLIRDTDAEYAMQNLIAIPDEMGISEENELEDLAEENLTKLKGEFKEYTETAAAKQIRGGSAQQQKKTQSIIELFQQAAEYLKAERDVDWEELEGAISEINDNRTLAELLEDLGDNVNSIIASNLPEEGVDRLTALYSNYGFGTDYQKDFNVNTITDELALVYITEIQEPTILTGNRDNFVQRGFLANPDNPNVRRNNPPAKPFKVTRLQSHLQNKRGQRYEFTRLFKSMFKGDLSKQDNISSQLAQNLKNRAVNRQTVLEVVSEIAYKINQDDITIAEAKSSSGLDFNVIADLIPNIKSADKDGFISDFQNTLFDEGGKGQRDIVRQYEQKMSDYKKGVPKIFKDFIEHIIYNPNIYEEVFNSIWTNSYTQFRQDSETSGFIHTGNIPGKSGKKIATWRIQRGNSGNSPKIRKLHRYLILNDRTVIAEESDEAQMGYMNLRKLYRKYVRENSEDKEEELFGNLLNITDKDESELLRNFTDPFEKTVASLFSEVKDDMVDLNDLTGDYDIKLGADINIVNMLQELRKTADVLGVTDISSMLQTKYPSKIKSDITNEELARVVKDFVSDLNNAVKKIVVNVKKLIEDKLKLMIRNQGRYLKLNDAIFMILEGKGLITEVGE